MLVVPKKPKPPRMVGIRRVDSPEPGEAGVYIGLLSCGHATVWQIARGVAWLLLAGTVTSCQECTRGIDV